MMACRCVLCYGPSTYLLQLSILTFHAQARIRSIRHKPEGT